MWSALRLVIIRLRRFMRSVAVAVAVSTVLASSLPLRMTRSADILKTGSKILVSRPRPRPTVTDSERKELK